MERWSSSSRRRIQRSPTRRWVSSFVLITKWRAERESLQLGWIGGVGQSFGGLVAPLILLLARRYGYQLTFFLSLLICCLSLFLSSFIRNLHWLLATYSFPYGFANTAIYILGTLLCGLYYPAGEHHRHVLVMCIISTGFPIGYHVMGAFIFNFIQDNGWQSMKRRIALLELAATVILAPFFTSRFLARKSAEHPRAVAATSSTEHRRTFYSMATVCWMLGIFSAMSAINNFLLHLVGCLMTRR